MPFLYSKAVPFWVGPQLDTVVVERSPSLRVVSGPVTGHVKKKTLRFEALLLCLALSTYRRPTGQLGVTIMVWPGTSLYTRGIMFHWASTAKTGRN